MVLNRLLAEYDPISIEELVNVHSLAEYFTGHPKEWESRQKQD